MAKRPDYLLDLTESEYTAANAALTFDALFAIASAAALVASVLRGSFVWALAAFALWFASDFFAGVINTGIIKRRVLPRQRARILVLECQVAEKDAALAAAKEAASKEA